MIEAPIHIYLIDADQNLAANFQKYISQKKYSSLKYSLTNFSNLSEALVKIPKNDDGIVLISENSESNIFTVLSKLDNKNPNLSKIAIIEDNNKNLSQELKRHGAHEVLQKNELNAKQLIHAMANAYGLCHLQNICPTPNNKVIKSAYDTKKIHQAPQKYLLNIINKSNEAIIVVDQNNVIQYVNDICRNIYDKNPQNLIGNNFYLPILHLENREWGGHKKYLDLNFVSFLAKSQETVEITVPSLISQKLIMEMRVSEIPWESLPVYLISLYDITNIKRVSSLTAEIKEKSRIDKLKDEFISIVSHEMRTPLTILKGAITNLKDGIVGPVSDKQIKVLETTERNVTRLSRIINNLLDLSRLESGKIKTNRHKVDLAPLIDEIIHNLTPIAKENSLVIQSHVPKQIPNVFADSDMIIQVLTNLIQNALRFAKKIIKVDVKSIILKKQVSQFAPSEMVQIDIVDDGEGISKDNLKILFNKFEQINRPIGGSGYKGTGLGLSICKQIIQLHNGKIWAESDVGHGSKFTIQIPRYHEYDDFFVALNDRLHEAQRFQTPLSILVISISNLTDMTENASDKDVIWMLEDLSKEIHNNALRKTDFFHFKRDTKEIIVILNETNRQTGEKIIQRIHNLTKDCFCPGKTGKIFVTLNIGMAVYPEDANEPNQLLDIAFQDAHST